MRLSGLEAVHDEASLWRECQRIFPKLNRKWFDATFNVLTGHLGNWYIEDRFMVRRFLQNPDIPQQFLHTLSALDTHDTVGDFLPDAYFENLRINPNGSTTRRAEMYAQIGARPREMVLGLLRWAVSENHYKWNEWAFVEFEDEYAILKKALVEFLILGVEKLARSDQFSNDRTRSGATLERTRWHITKCLNHSGAMDHWTKQCEFPKNLPTLIKRRAESIMTQSPWEIADDAVSVFCTPYPPLIDDFYHNPSVIELWYNSTTRSWVMIDRGS